MSEAKRLVNIYSLSGYISRLEERTARMEKKIVQLKVDLLQFEVAMQALKHLQLVKPFKYLKAESAGLEKQLAKYQAIKTRRTEDIMLLKGLTKGEMRLYCVTQASGHKSYVKADHSKLAEMVCTCLKDPAITIVAI